MTSPAESATFQQAMEHHRAGRLAEAEKLYRQVVVEQPALVPGWGNLGLLLQTSGRFAEAAKCFARIGQLQPNNAQAFNHLGMALGSAGRFQEAAEALRTATRLDPSLGTAFSNLSIALAETGQLRESESAAIRAAELEPNNAMAHTNLAAALLRLKRPGDAVAPARRAVALQPDLAAAHYNLGMACSGAGEIDEAVAGLRRTLELEPDHADARKVLVGMLRDTGQSTEAMRHCRVLLEKFPDDGHLWNLTASVLHWEGDAPAAIPYYRRALELDPSSAKIASNLLLTFHYLPETQPRELYEEHLHWAARHTAGITPMHGHSNDPDPDRPLRIGYVSPDFRWHSVSFFFEPLLAHHDRSRCVPYLYSDTSSPDRTTQRLRALAGEWRETAGMSDERFCDLVREDRIDILIDCAGHTSNNRLVAFALKPAPVQVTYLGYPNTTGVRAIDYRITDSIADSPGETDQLHTEQLVRIDPCAWCYGPPPDAVDVPIVQRTGGDLVFGCFGALLKLNGPWIESCARILAQVPGSKLAIKSPPLRDETILRQVRDTFAAHGIAGERLNLLAPQRKLGDHLAAYGEIDIALDSFPYHGTTTTCEALWMGVPVVSLAGQAHVSRVGASLLSAVGSPQWLASSREQFIDTAVKLASDLPRRRDLRERMRASSLMDAPAYARQLERAYRDMWRAWCAARSADE